MPYKDPEEASVAKSHLQFPVVGIGASAGGLAALLKLLGDLPADSGMAFVVVMHLSPEHESSLGPILQRSGKFPVVTVTSMTPIEVNHVYVISPALKLMMTDGHLSVSPLSTLEGRRGSIDLFFRSLAQAHEERAVGIVLTGTGSDGAQGLRRVKELGGVALAQSLEDAEFDGMPRAAIQTGMVDFVLPVAEMAAKLILLWQNAKRIELPQPPVDLDVKGPLGEDEVQAEEALVSIKALLRERTGHDFAHYKRGTVLRRIERRMQVTAVPDLASYRRVLDSEPGETPALLQDMLISVTNFFRDPESFDALEKPSRPWPRRALWTGRFVPGWQAAPRVKKHIRSPSSCARSLGKQRQSRSLLRTSTSGRSLRRARAYTRHPFLRTSRQGVCASSSWPRTTGCASPKPRATPLSSRRTTRSAILRSPAWT